MGSHEDGYYWDTKDGKVMRGGRSHHVPTSIAYHR